jgi:hypothetical protein
VPKTTTWFLLGDRVVPDCWTPYLDPAIARSA